MFFYLYFFISIIILINIISNNNKFFFNILAEFNMLHGVNFFQLKFSLSTFYFWFEITFTFVYNFKTTESTIFSLRSLNFLKLFFIFFEIGFLIF